MRFNPFLEMSSIVFNIINTIPKEKLGGFTLSTKPKNFGELEFVKSTKWSDWLKTNHNKKPGVWVIFPKKGTNEPTITFEEALDTALAYGWIDISIRKIDERTYGRKFTPRREKSAWSETNIERVQLLKKRGKMRKWGLEAYERRPESRKS
jgi:uncharacterized protein YdeI (YjbR/CyaY-like superfamily)